ncbi:hypothetical protein HOU02_gp355 [Caulobacter phage CcrBL9]|uniref:Uncharacterized protein n=1 Tax=Caulobacter phage CcrBL9 TaxID=2283270 RepID=A0A385ECJ3_9CAUD|nr:hypothetical protein HOU02_gp355 [Caulobacter phage CcrBL9]AXQ69370.1 hypothetical protein CcrBL9_gp346 [Caulobacter phage CcrBL9]
MAAKAPNTKAGREALNTIRDRLKPLGMDVRFETGSKHNYIVVRGHRQQDLWRLTLTQGCKSHQGTYIKVAEGFCRQVKAAIAA